MSVGLDSLLSRGASSKDVKAWLISRMCRGEQNGNPDCISYWKGGMKCAFQGGRSMPRSCFGEGKCMRQRPQHMRLVGSAFPCPGAAGAPREAWGIVGLPRNGPQCLLQQHDKVGKGPSPETRMEHLLGPSPSLHCSFQSAVRLVLHRVPGGL